MKTDSDHQARSQLGDVAEAIFFGFNFSRRTRAGADGVSTPIIHVKDVIDGALPFVAELDQTSFDSSGVNSKFSLRRGDILVSARGTLMKCALIDEEHAGILASMNFIVIRPKLTVIPELLWAFLRHPKIQAAMLSKSRGSVQPSLNINDLASLEISIPSHAIQKDLAHLIRASERQYAIAQTLSKMRREECLDIVIEYMDLML